MILLDTNVVSEPMRQRPYPHVQDWLDAQAAETLWLSTISLSATFAIPKPPAARYAVRGDVRVPAEPVAARGLSGVETVEQAFHQRAARRL